ncbi:MAG: NAD(P)H-dependent oxidoreductase subunit E [Rhizobiaceae bacterium]|nr:NAD(P)H-dependent oxidoreductase subunit E [Rhizobiaceae bacterium]
MQRIAGLAELRPGVAKAISCFSEQGTPSLREALFELRDPSLSSIVIVPLALPLEPSFLRWVTKSIRRWQAERPGEWPPIHITRDIGQSLHFEPLLSNLIEGAASSLPIAPTPSLVAEGSLVPPQKRRVLVCTGPTCNAEGADALWGHLRNVQERRKLRATGDGTMTAKATCLGPCNLAPVLQVFPEGTYYGGVTERAIDQIADEHLLGGRVVDAFAYQPTGRKQRLRIVAQTSSTPKETET